MKKMYKELTRKDLLMFMDFEQGRDEIIDRNRKHTEIEVKNYVDGYSDNDILKFSAINKLRNHIKFHTQHVIYTLVLMVILIGAQIYVMNNRVENLAVSLLTLQLLFLVLFITLNVRMSYMREYNRIKNKR